ncbi:MAG: serine hydrolase [Pyrinomonadaceae bacterium]|nr:serine hydrolase [Pyrinomonadaceae bacterium]
MKSRISTYYIAIFCVAAAFAFAQAVVGQAAGGKLTSGEKVSRNIKPGDKHRFEIDLDSDRFAFFRLRQDGADVTLTSYSPDNKKIETFDSPNGTEGMEFANIAAKKKGKYFLEIQALGNSGPLGKYHLEFESAGPIAKTASGKVDQLFKPWANNDSPGVAVAIVQNGRIVYKNGYGMANLEYDVPVKPDTVFHIASVSKQFTTFSVLLLEKDGKLSLDDDIRKYVPEVPNFGHKITLRHLAHHTSGLRDQWNLLALAGWRLDDVITLEHILSLVRRQKALNFEPGAEYAYSNTGYTLLAEVVARVSGKSFPEFTRERIFKPLGMTKTLFYDDHEKIVKNRAYSYRPAKGGVKKVVLSYANVGATSLFTTVEDLSKWAMNFEDTKVGDEAIIEKMKTRGVLNSGRKISYALGQVVGKYRGLNQISHGGGDAGYRTYFSRFPDQKFSVVVFSNDGAFNSRLIASKVADIYLKDEFIEKSPFERLEVKIAPTAPPNKTVKVDPAILDSYVGQYQLAPNFIITVAKKDGGLSARATGQGQFTLKPLAADRFVVEGVEATVSFHKGPDGKVNLLKLDQGGRVQDAKRIKAFDPTKVNLEAFTGDFYSDELETTYALVVQDGKLTAKHIRNRDITMIPVRKDRFRGQAWFVGNVEFVRDQGGSISGLKFSTGRVRNVAFKKLRKKDE